MIRGLGVYAPMALLPGIIIDKIRQKCNPDIYRTSCMILKMVCGDNVKYRFWIDRSPEAMTYHDIVVVEVSADELTSGEPTVIDTVLKVGASSAIKEI